MAPDIKHSYQDAPSEFHRIFRWYLDYGLDAPSRRQAMKDLSQILEVSERTIEMWVKERKPSQWKMVLTILEDKYGPPPEDLKGGDGGNEV